MCSNEYYDSGDDLKDMKPKFVVKHYAGEVEYCVAGFIEKNKDEVSSLIEEACQKSSNVVLSFEFHPDRAEEEQK